MADLEGRLRALEQRLDVAESVLAIQRLKADYAALVDQRHRRGGGVRESAVVERVAREVAALFTEDGIWDGGGALGICRGRDEIAHRLASPTVQWAWHFFLKPRITVDGDEARGTWDVFSPCTLADGSQRWMAGVETDTYRRIGGRWLHASMKLETVMFAPYETGWARPGRDGGAAPEGAGPAGAGGKDGKTGG